MADPQTKAAQTTAQTATSPARGISAADLAVAVGVTALGAALLYGATRIPFGINAVVGPRVFPLIVSVGLIALGLVALVGALRGERAEPAVEEDTDPTAPVNHAATNVILGGFVAGALLLPSLGFVLGTSLMFASVAFAFGERRWALIVGAALGVSVIAYLAFTRGLGLTLPPGVLRGLL